MNTLAGNVFTCGTAALVELKHAEGKNLAGCHLHQGVEVRTSLNPGVVMGDPDDYGSFMGAADPFYGGTWLFDTPMVQVALAPLEDFYHWFEAHDYVEENPSVENRFGFAGHARDPALAIASAGSDYDAMAVNTGFARWRNRQVPFFIPPIGMQNLDL